MRSRKRGGGFPVAVALAAALSLAGSPGTAEAGWWGGGLELRFGWPPIRFEKVRAGEDPAKIGPLVEASLTRDAWERTAPHVRGIATGDSRDEIETVLAVKTHEVSLPEGGVRKVKIAEGYLHGVSTPRRMEFGYIEDHLVIREWTVLFDKDGRVVETAVYPVGRNEALLKEPRPKDDPGEGTPVSAYALDYRLGLVRSHPFLSETGWRHAAARLRDLRPGQPRLDFELAVDGRYYIYGVDAWFLANGFLPQASFYDAGQNRETLAFGWDQGGVPQVKARVILEDDRVSEVRFEDKAP